MIHEVLKRQQEYFLAGKTRPIRWRKEQLKKLKALLKANETEIADAIYKDFGKSYFEVIENELSLIYVEISIALRNLRRWSRASRPLTSLVNLPGQSRVYSQPYGNVLVISPWNYPLQLALIPVVHALAAGNTVILKPSELTANTSGIIAECISGSFSQDIIYVREGGIKETTELLSMPFNKIFFTGSTRVGKIVMKAAAEHLTPVTLELGGKNPVLVLPDCDIKMTAKRLVWGKFHNGGQACVAPDHIYVHETIKDKLLEQIRLNIDKMYGGDAGSSEAFPRIINEANFKRLVHLIDHSKVYLGGGSDQAKLFIEPTVLVDVEHTDPVMQEEVFGPLMPLLNYTELDAVLNIIKEQAAPLALYVFTKSISRAKQIQQEIRSGGGMINDTVVHFVNSSTPFGGFGESGMGSYHGKAGFECFSHRKSVLKKPLWFEMWVKYPPYTGSKLKIIRTLLR